MQDLAHLEDSELSRLREFWAEHLPTAHAVERLRTIDREVQLRRNGRRTAPPAPSTGWFLVPGGLADELELACYGARLTCDPLAGTVSGSGFVCELETNETGKVLATLKATGSEPVRRVFARRFDARHPWEEVGSAQGGAAVGLFDDRALAAELVAWIGRSL